MSARHYEILANLFNMKRETVCFETVCALANAGMIDIDLAMVDTLGSTTIAHHHLSVAGRAVGKEHLFKRDARNAKARANRKARSEVLDSLGLVRVRGGNGWE